MARYPLGWSRSSVRFSPRPPAPHDDGAQVVRPDVLGRLGVGLRLGGPVIEDTRDYLLLRLPLPRQLLGLGYLGRGHHLGNAIAVLDRFIAVLAGGEYRSGKVKPHMGLYVVLRHTLAFTEHDSEIAVSFSVALLGGLAIPLQRLSVVLGDA